MVVIRSFEPPALLAATIRGVITATDQAEVTGWIRDAIRETGAVLVLLHLVDFGGWRPAALDDRAAWLTDHEPVRRIAIVGQPEWRAQVLTAMSAPLRQTPIEYFDNEPDARVWLAQSGAATTRSSTEQTGGAGRTTSERVP